MLLFWMHIFMDRESCGLINICINVDGALVFRSLHVNLGGFSFLLHYQNMLKCRLQNVLSCRVLGT